MNMTPEAKAAGLQAAELLYEGSCRFAEISALAAGIPVPYLIAWADLTDVERTVFGLLTAEPALGSERLRNGRP